MDDFPLDDSAWTLGLDMLLRVQELEDRVKGQGEKLRAQDEQLREMAKVLGMLTEERDQRKAAAAAACADSFLRSEFVADAVDSGATFLRTLSAWSPSTLSDVDLLDAREASEAHTEQASAGQAHPLLEDSDVRSFDVRAHLGEHALVRRTKDAVSLLAVAACPASQSAKLEHVIPEVREVARMFGEQACVGTQQPVLRTLQLSRR